MILERRVAYRVELPTHSDNPSLCSSRSPFRFSASNTAQVMLNTCHPVQHNLEKWSNQVIARRWIKHCKSAYEPSKVLDFFSPKSSIPLSRRQSIKDEVGEVPYRGPGSEYYVGLAHGLRDHHTLTRHQSCWGSVCTLR